MKILKTQLCILCSYIGEYLPLIKNTPLSFSSYQTLLWQNGLVSASFGTTNCMGPFKILLNFLLSTAISLPP